MSTMTIASHGQPSRKAPSGPLLTHFLQPIQSMGSTSMRPNGGWSGSSTQNMQSSTGQYSTQAGEPAQPVQHSVITANSFGFFLRAVMRPFERGSIFSSSGTIPGVFVTSDPVAIEGNYIPGGEVFNLDLSAAFQPLKSMRRSQSSLRDLNHFSHFPQR